MFFTCNSNVYTSLLRIANPIDVCLYSLSYWYRLVIMDYLLIIPFHSLMMLFLTLWWLHSYQWARDCGSWGDFIELRGMDYRRCDMSIDIGIETRYQLLGIVIFWTLMLYSELVGLLFWIVINTLSLYNFNMLWEWHPIFFSCSTSHGLYLYIQFDVVLWDHKYMWNTFVWWHGILGPGTSGRNMM